MWDLSFTAKGINIPETFTPYLYGILDYNVGAIFKLPFLPIFKNSFYGQGS